MAAQCLRKAVRLVSIAAVSLFAFINITHADQCCLATQGQTQLRTDIIASGLNKPWGMAFLPDGSVLVTEKPGQLRRVNNGKLSSPVKGLPEITEIGQGGLLDIALDPDFAENRLVYLSFAQAATNGQGFGTAVARGVLDVANLRLEDTELIFSSNRKVGGGRHFGSRIRFAPDKTLFITIGDRGTQMRAQDPFDHAGSVIRINRDGSIPTDNPFINGDKALPEIWSVGHRNPQGAAIHPLTGEFWTLSHGAAGGDEINIARKGLNYGWPLISYGQNYSGAPFELGDTADDLEQPIYYWDPSIAPSGFDFYMPDKALIPDWQGSVLAGALRGQHLSRLILDGNEVVGEERYFEGTFGRIRDVRSGPDGAVWLLTDDGNGKLIRITQK